MANYLHVYNCDCGHTFTETSDEHDLRMSCPSVECSRDNDEMPPTQSYRLAMPEPDAITTLRVLVNTFDRTGDSSDAYYAVAGDARRCVTEFDSIVKQTGRLTRG